MRHEGFHGRAGFGDKPALLVVDVNVGFTDDQSPLACALDDVVLAIDRLLREFRKAEFPIDTKYGDVVGVDDVVAHLEEVGAAHPR